MNINGDLTVDAVNAIDTRGYATININTDGKHTTVINGDIVFETPWTPSNPKSGNIIDSYVNVNLNGEASSWTGRAYQEFNGEQSIDINTNRQYYGDVTGFKMNFSNGAVWNMTGDSFINDVTVADNASINVQNAVKKFNASAITLNKGILDLQGDGQSVNVTKLQGSEGLSGERGQFSSTFGLLYRKKY